MSENDDLAIKRFVSTSKGTIVIGKMSIDELVKLTGEDPKTEKDKNGTITANYTASGNNPFCDSASHRGELESSINGRGVFVSDEDFSLHHW